MGGSFILSEKGPITLSQPRYNGEDAFIIAVLPGQIFYLAAGKRVVPGFLKNPGNHLVVAGIKFGKQRQIMVLHVGSFLLCIVLRWFEAEGHSTPAFSGYHSRIFSQQQGWSIERSGSFR